jgi:type II secretory pathway pseudopilin PulG
MKMKKHAAGFTIVDLMIVVTVIGLLAAIAVPNFIMARENAQNARFIGDMRVARGAFTMYYVDTGGYPIDQLPAIIPTGMQDYLGRMQWAGPTSLGGQWDWDHQQFGFVAGVSVYRPTVPLTQLAKIDRQIDDGNFDTGNFRARSSGYISILE